jgi:hypothetical protein
MEQDERDASEDYGDEFVIARDRSKVEYNTSIGSNAPYSTCELIDLVLRLILEIKGGVLLDPQLGEFEFVKPIPPPNQASTVQTRRWWEIWK